MDTRGSRATANRTSHPQNCGKLIADGEVALPMNQNGRRRWRSPWFVIVTVVVVAVVIFAIAHKSHSPSGSSAVHPGGAWLSPLNQVLLESEFPTRLQDAVDQTNMTPIRAMDANCTQTSTQGVYNCTVDTEYDDQIAYFVSVSNGGSWTGKLNSSQTYDASQYPSTLTSGPST
jgi:hypothetical protein